ncbi:MAG: M20/M25/M40 family metallo-hydrolase, partial [Oscillospiraceae bacterium]|nr:M20/M25/M40 family metallo-hydrolase [Oscillospiraceae bacterium]
GDVFPGLPVCPYVMTGGTDARFYQEICDACIRFGPVAYSPEQMQSMHGLNENIDCSSLTGAVDFYKTVIRCNS